MHSSGRLMVLVHVFAVKYLEAQNSIVGVGTNPIGPQ